MKKKQENTESRFRFLIAAVIFILLWEFLVESGTIERFLLPSPTDILKALKSEFFILANHTKVTLVEACLGLFFGILAGFIFAILMDVSKIFKDIFYPLIILTQVVPTVAIAPLLVLWFGYGTFPKVFLIILTTFFPIAIGVYGGFVSIDRDYLNLLKSMGADDFQIFKYLKIPSAMDEFFSGLRISVAYSIVTAVISEWLGGFSGLGVYMLRVKKSFSFDKMFAVIIIISVLSLILMKLVDYLRIKIMKWER